jgi:hypothetical protein
MGMDLAFVDWCSENKWRDIYGDHVEHKTWTFEELSACLQLLDKCCFFSAQGNRVASLHVQFNICGCKWGITITNSPCSCLHFLFQSTCRHDLFALIFPTFLLQFKLPVCLALFFFGGQTDQISGPLNKSIILESEPFRHSAYLDHYCPIQLCSLG